MATIKRKQLIKVIQATIASIKDEMKSFFVDDKEMEEMCKADIKDAMRILRFLRHSVTKANVRKALGKIDNLDTAAREIYYISALELGYDLNEEY